MKPDTVIVRFSGEIGVKSEWTRRIYEKHALRNLKQMLKNAGLKSETIERMRGRIYIKTQSPTETAKALTRVFGITSVSPAKQTTSEFKAIAETALAMADEVIKDHMSFSVRCHRVGTHPYTSIEVCRQLGEQILEVYKLRELKVNLTKPEVTITVEVRDQNAYVYVQTLQGAGGFPVGTQTSTVCLLSGGIDSPVACWLTMKRGCPAIPVYVDNSPYVDEISKQKAFETARILKEWSAGYIKKMYIIPNGENMKTIQQNTPSKFTCLFCKRLMYRIAERIATIENAVGIVTGEAIGEQASQTMQNLYVINEAAKHYPIHRPLLGFDKTETEDLARNIGTYETSVRKTQGCTAVPAMPSTQAKLEAVKEAEEKLDITNMVEKAIQAKQIIQLD